MGRPVEGFNYSSLIDGHNTVNSSFQDGATALFFLRQIGSQVLLKSELLIGPVEFQTFFLKKSFSLLAGLPFPFNTTGKACYCIHHSTLSCEEKTGCVATLR